MKQEATVDTRSLIIDEIEKLALSSTAVRDVAAILDRTINLCRWLREANAKLDAPVPIALMCPRCHQQHVDEGEWATKPHRKHLCVAGPFGPGCGALWQPGDMNTVGVMRPWTIHDGKDGHPHDDEDDHREPNLDAAVMARLRAPFGCEFIGPGFPIPEEAPRKGHWRIHDANDDAIASVAPAEEGYARLIVEALNEHHERKARPQIDAVKLPNPTPEMLNGDPLFEAIYGVMSWDVLKLLDTERKEFREALAPLVAIADAYDSNNLDDEARKWWGADGEPQTFNTRTPESIELYSGRGGKELLTLAHCLAARKLVRGGT